MADAFLSKVMPGKKRQSRILSAESQENHFDPIMQFLSRPGLPLSLRRLKSTERGALGDSTN